MLAEGVQVLGMAFPGSSLQQDVLLFVRYLLETLPNLVLEAPSKGEPLPPLLSPPSYGTSSGGWGGGWHPWLAQLQCDHLKGR